MIEATTLVQARVAQARDMLRMHPPDGSTARLKAHALLLRIDTASSEARRSIDALADIALALDKLTTMAETFTIKQLREIAVVFEEKGNRAAEMADAANGTEHLQKASDGWQEKANTWREAAAILRQVAAGEKT